MKPTERRELGRIQQLFW